MKQRGNELMAKAFEDHMYRPMIKEGYVALTKDAVEKLYKDEGVKSKYVQAINSDFANTAHFRQTKLRFESEKTAGFREDIQSRPWVKDRQVPDEARIYERAELNKIKMGAKLFDGLGMTSEMRDLEN